MKIKQEQDRKSKVAQKEKKRKEEITKEKKRKIIENKKEEIGRREKKERSWREKEKRRWRKWDTQKKKKKKRKRKKKNNRKSDEIRRDEVRKKKTKKEMTWRGEDSIGRAWSKGPQGCYWICWRSVNATCRGSQEISDYSIRVNGTHVRISPKINLLCKQFGFSILMNFLWVQNSGKIHFEPPL